jgi:hypothetical protein
MGGILGNEAWRRSNGGLWLPRVFGMPETVYGWCCCGSEFVLCQNPLNCGNCQEGEPEHGDDMPVTVTGISGECIDCERYDDILNISLPFMRSYPGYCFWETYIYYLETVSCWLARPTIGWTLWLLGCQNPTYYFWQLRLLMDTGYAGYSNSVVYMSDIFDEKPLCFNTQYNLSLYEIASSFTDPEGYLYCDYSESSAVIGPMVK